MTATSAFAVDETHDPSLRSWVESAAPGRSHFPIQNMPFGVFSLGSLDRSRIGVRIGDSILNVQALDPKLIDLGPEVRDALNAPVLNGLMAVPAAERRRLRAGLSALLRAGGGDERIRRTGAERAMVPAAEVRMQLPAAIGSFTDFYACRNHALTAGRVLRRGEPAPLPVNWTWMPLGCHGRAAAVQVGGMPVLRPMGQRRLDRGRPPSFGPTGQLDYEAELGAFVGPGCASGRRIPIEDAVDHLFGYVLVNDWSARDMQTWEGGPLGPFLSKSFATSVSPWVVTGEALAPFRAPACPRQADDPEPLPYLDGVQDRALGGLAITIEAHLRTGRMRDESRAAQCVSRADARDLYWTMQQMLAHAASNGSGLAPGDLLASGTISGDAEGTRGCLLETTQRGRVPLAVGGEERGFLHDGDEVSLTARCERDGYVTIGFGECVAVVAPHRDDASGLDIGLPGRRTGAVQNWRVPGS